MFGCIAFLVGGHAVAGVWKRSLIARVGPANYEEALSNPMSGSSTSPASR